MNLHFQRIGETDTHYIERAKIPSPRENAALNKAFWKTWKTSESFREVVSVRPEESRFFAYRQVSKNNRLALKKFQNVYYLKNQKHLLPYQPRAVANHCACIIRNKASIDASDTGTGKTFVTTAVARELGYRLGIICTKGGIPNWQEAADYMGVPVAFAVNWEAARTGKFPFCKRTVTENKWILPGRTKTIKHYAFTWKLPSDVLLVFDEAHHGSNTKSQNGKMFLAARGHPVMIVSATLADQPARMWPFIFIVSGMTWAIYRDWLRKRGHFEQEKQPTSSEQDMAELHRALFPAYGYRLRATDPDVQEFFPGAMIGTLLLRLDDKQTRQQNAVYARMLEKRDSLLDKGDQIQALNAVHFYRQTAELLKADALMEIASTHISEGRSVVLFVHYLDTLSYIVKRAKTTSIIAGDQDRKYGIERRKVISEFQADRSRLIVAMGRAGGQSINLHDVTGKHQRVALISPCYESIVIKQIYGRVNRAKSKTVPIIQMVYAAGTIEEEVAARVKDKIRSIDALNDGDLMPEGGE